MSKSWRKRLLDSGLELTDRHIRVLKHGPSGPSDRNVMSKMKRFYKEKIERIRRV